MVTKEEAYWARWRQLARAWARATAEGKGGIVLWAGLLNHAQEGGRAKWRSPDGLLGNEAQLERVARRVATESPGRGRPPLDPDGSLELRIRVTRVQGAKLDAVVKDLGLSGRAAAVRHAIDLLPEAE